MKKRSTIIKSFVIGSALTLISAFYFFINRTNTKMNNLALNNIEALAEGEWDEQITVVCMGSGDIICPIQGDKVLDYVIWYKE